MKIKKIIIVFVLAMAPWFVVAQSQFDKFEDIDGVSSVIVNQRAFSLMSKIGAESDDEYLQLINNLNSLKVFATESADVARKMEDEVNKYLKTSKLEELMRVKDGDDRVIIYVKEGKTDDFVEELFMFVKDVSDNSGESVIISLTGNIDLNQVSKLTSSMDIPGGQHLDKAKKQ